MSTPPVTREQWAAEQIAQRQGWIARAQADIGRQVATALNRRPSGHPGIDGELARIDQAQATIAELARQVRAVDVESRAGRAVLRCGSCRSGIAPGQRFCTVCGAAQAPDVPAVSVPAVVPVSVPAACARCGRPDAGGAYCASCGWRVGQTQLRFYRSRWFRILLAGLALYVFCQVVLPHAGYAGALIVAELIIGASLIPVVYVSWLYERGSRDQVPFAVIASTFVSGAVLGCAAAVVLESAFHTGGNLQYIPVGLIEEGCKIALVLLWLRRRDLSGVDKGLVIGAATGMGFAALETMQYGFDAFFVTLRDGGGLEAVHALSGTLTVRGVLAPLGHGTWTGILAAVIWSQRANGRRVLGVRTLVAYVAVSLLHAVYDITIDLRAGSLPFVSGSRVSIIGLLLGLVGLVTLLLMVRSIHRGHDPVETFFDRVTGRTRRSGPPPTAYVPGGSWGPS